MGACIFDTHGGNKSHPADKDLVVNVKHIAVTTRLHWGDAVLSVNYVEKQGALFSMDDSDQSIEINEDTVLV